MNEVPQKPGPRAYLRFNRALFYYYLGEKSKAFADIDSIYSIEGVPKRYIEYAQELKGYLLLDQNDITGARSAFLNRKSNTNLPDTYDSNLAMLFFAQGQLDSCRYYREKAVMKIDSANHAEMENHKPLWLVMTPMYCELLQSELLIKSDSLEQSIDYYNHIRFPSRVYSASAGGNVYYNIPLEKDVIPRALIKKGDIDEAIETYEKMTEFQPDQKDRFFINPKYHYRLALLYQQTGQRQKGYRAIQSVPGYLEECR